MLNKFSIRQWLSDNPIRVKSVLPKYKQWALPPSVCPPQMISISSFSSFPLMLLDCKKKKKKTKKKKKKTKKKNQKQTKPKKLEHPNKWN